MPVPLAPNCHCKHPLPGLAAVAFCNGNPQPSHQNLLFSLHYLRTCSGFAAGIHIAKFTSMTEKETPAAALAMLKNIREQAHPNCFVCSSTNPMGLGIDYTVMADGGVQGSLPGGHLFQGYNGVVHGGIIAALMDGAMTNCLFAAGRKALTAELKIRYRQSVSVGESITVRAWIESCSYRLHCLRAELTQTGRVKAIATAKFMERHEHN